jgi:hypothetical protein
MCAACGARCRRTSDGVKAEQRQAEDRRHSVEAQEVQRGPPRPHLLHHRFRTVHQRLPGCTTCISHVPRLRRTLRRGSQGEQQQQHHHASQVRQIAASRRVSLRSRSRRRRFPAPGGGAAGARSPRPAAASAAAPARHWRPCRAGVVELQPTQCAGRHWWRGGMGASQRRQQGAGNRVEHSAGAGRGRQRRAAHIYHGGLLADPHSQIPS